MSDQSVPVRVANATIEVQFVEDKLPRFENLPRIQVVSENAQVDTSIYRIRSDDDDEQVSTKIAYEREWIFKYVH